MESSTSRSSRHSGENVISFGGHSQSLPHMNLDAPTKDVFRRGSSNAAKVNHQFMRCHRWQANLLAPISAGPAAKKWLPPPGVNSLRLRANLVETLRKIEGGQIGQDKGAEGHCARTDYGPSGPGQCQIGRGREHVISWLRTGGREGC